LPNNALARLIVAAKERDQTNYRAMAKRAIEAGERISSAQLNNYALSANASAPNPQQVRAIAKATGHTVVEVTAALVEEFYGLAPTDLSQAATNGFLHGMLPADLPADEQRELRKLIVAWLGAREM
jgi:hypothetical protein